MNMQFEQCQFGIVGAGLIGTSMAKAIARRYPQADIVFFDENAANIEGAIAQLPRAKGVQLHDFASTDFVMICTPVSYIADYALKLKQIVDPVRCTITDVGSTKAWIAAAVEPKDLPHFVPGHLLAGGTSSGPANASVDIVFGRNFALTPHQHTDKAHLDRAELLLKAIGLNVIIASPQLHDDVLAITSHIPHMLAYALIDILSATEDEHHTSFSSLEVNSFKQMTHFVKGDPEMWADIIMSNREQISIGLKTLFDAAQNYMELAQKADKAQLIVALNKLRDRRNVPGDKNV